MAVPGAGERPPHRESIDCRRSPAHGWRAIVHDRRVSDRGRDASRARDLQAAGNVENAILRRMREDACAVRRRGPGSVKRFTKGICLLCDLSAGIETNLCDACRDDLPIIPDACASCGSHAIPGTGTCPACTLRHPPMDRTVCAVAYGSPVDYLVGRLKFDCDLRVVPALAGLLVRAVGGEPTPDWLVPVPIGAARLRKRGFNQALELARYLGDIRGVRVSGIMRRRRGYETPQSSLPDTSARRANVAGAFEARAAIDGHVVVVDDVVTTGATVSALARCLKRAGASRVDAWAVARTP